MLLLLSILLLLQLSHLVRLQSLYIWLAFHDVYWANKLFTHHQQKQSMPERQTKREWESEKDSDGESVSQTDKEIVRLTGWDSEASTSVARLPIWRAAVLIFSHIVVEAVELLAPSFSVPLSLFLNKPLATHTHTHTHSSAVWPERAECWATKSKGTLHDQVSNFIMFLGHWLDDDSSDDRNGQDWAGLCRPQQDPTAEQPHTYTHTARQADSACVTGDRQRQQQTNIQIQKTTDVA